MFRDTHATDIFPENQGTTLRPDFFASNTPGDIFLDKPGQVHHGKGTPGYPGK